MALPTSKPVPPPDQRRRLDAYLAELAPLIPANIELNPQWEPDYSGWTLWVVEKDGIGSEAFCKFIDSGYALAERHGIEADLIPVETKAWE